MRKLIIIPSRFLFPSLATLLTLLVISACRVTDLPLWHLQKPLPANSEEVTQIRDVAYFEGPDASSLRHRLDLFLPKGKTDFPVVVLVHGGSWMLGDNRCCGLYSNVGEFFASQGIGAVLPNYRLSPGVKHPEHIKDLARAVAWTQKHIAEYGGRPDQLFVMGHSAGGHLVSLLATDEKYLHAEGHSTADIKGVIAISGVYRIPAGKMDVTLGGPSTDAFHLNEVAPLRNPTEPGRKPIAPGLPLSLNVYGPAFGDDPLVRADASPINHVRPGLPPFLLFAAENDLPSLRGMAEDFHQALLENGCQSQYLCVPNRNHNSIQFHAIEPDDPVARRVLDFIRRRGLKSDGRSAIIGPPINAR